VKKLSLERSEACLLFDTVDREATARSLSARSIIVMPALVAGIHVLIFYEQQKTWMAGRQGAYARLRRAMPGHDEVG
jgi:hypothetical protein